MSERHRAAGLLLCGIMTAAALSGCTSDRDPNAPDSTGVVSVAEETKAATAETTTETEPVTTTTVTETTQAATESQTAEVTVKPAVPGSGKQGNDDDTKLLHSERGLEAVPKDSTDGYGEPLTAGETYLSWKLEGFDGTVSGDSVSEVKADFLYDGKLSQNGQIRVLPAGDAQYPNGLYMHVDNIADFPYFPKDTRDRGWYVIENAEEVLKLLGLESAGAISGDLSVTVTIDALHMHVAANQYDTVHVTAASRR